MGLGDWLSRRRVGDGIPGEAEVLTVELTWKSAHQTEKRNLDHRMRLSVSAEMAAPYEVEHECTVPWDRLPSVGQVLPVTVSSSDPHRLVIEWGGVETAAERAERLAEGR